MGLRGLGSSPDDASARYMLTGVAGTDTITGAATPKIPALIAGISVTFTPAATNTGAATVNIDSEGAKDIYRNGAALVGGELQINVPTALYYDGTRFHIVGGAVPAGFDILQGQAFA